MNYELGRICIATLTLIVASETAEIRSPLAHLYEPVKIEYTTPLTVAPITGACFDPQIHWRR
jgi:hypothetical protein